MELLQNKKRKVDDGPNRDKDDDQRQDELSEPAGIATPAGSAYAPLVWPQDASWSPEPRDFPFLPGVFSERVLQHAHDKRVFTASLVAWDDPDIAPVPVVTADLLSISDWFDSVVTHRDEMAGGPLDRVRVPCDVPRALLQAVVTSMYTGSLHVSATTLAPLLQLAGAMLMPRLTATCGSWAVESLDGEGLTAEWVQHLLALTRLMDLPDLEAALQDTLLHKCVATLADNDIAALAVALAGQQLAATTDNTDGQPEQLVCKLRSALKNEYGPHCPEAFLVTLLANMSQHGLRIAPLMPHVDSTQLHKLDVQALLESEVTCGDLVDDVAFHRMLIKAALHGGADCQHAVFELKQFEGESVELGPVSRGAGAAGHCKVIAAKSKGGAVGVYLHPPTERMHARSMGLYFWLYSLSEGKISWHFVDLEEADGKFGDGWGYWNIEYLLPDYRGLLGVFLWPYYAW